MSTTELRGAIHVLQGLLTEAVSVINTIDKLEAQTAPVQEPVAWVPYIIDRADGVHGHYAIARWNPRGYREVWNLRRHTWGAFTDDVMPLEDADYLLQQITIPTRKPTPPNVATPPAAQPAPVQEPYARIYETEGPYGLHQSLDCRPYNGRNPDRVVPVYTTPPAAQPAERTAVPLTDEQIDDEHDKLFPPTIIPGARARVREFARAIEAAHGITEKGQQ